VRFASRIAGSVAISSVAARAIAVDTTREQIRTSPEFDRSTPVTHEDEQRLADHYAAAAARRR
jgi:hypothetical protein